MKRLLQSSIESSERSDAKAVEAEGPEVPDAVIIVLDPVGSEGRQIANWLRSAGLGNIATARTCDEALLLLGRRNARLLIIDERISAAAERRLFTHIASFGHARVPPLVRVIAGGSSDPLALGKAMAAEAVHKPLSAHDVVMRAGIAIHRSDLVRRMDEQRNESSVHLETARRMQVALLPTPEQLDGIQTGSACGVAGFYQPGDAVGGDFWGVWPASGGRLALALADFAGHGLSAALNTFRLHAILSEQALPFDDPVGMAGLLNKRLSSLLECGQYATMLYACINPALRHIAWCSAGGPAPIFVSAEGSQVLSGRGLPLGIAPHYAYQLCEATMPSAGILCVFSDGLYEGGKDVPEITRAEITQSVSAAARLADSGLLTQAAQEAVASLQALRRRHPCPGHSDDVLAACVAFGR